MDGELSWSFDLAGIAEPVADHGQPLSRERQSRFAKVFISTGFIALAASFVVSIREAVVTNHQPWSDVASIAHIVHPDGVAINTLVALGFLAIALFAKRGATGRLPELSEMSATAMFLVALVPALAHLYTADVLTHVDSFAPMKPLTSVALLLVAVGVIAREPSGPLMKFIAGGTPGSVLVRRLVPQFTLLFLALGWLRVWGQERGYYDWKVGVVGMVICSIAFFVTGIALTAIALNKSSTERDRAESALREHELRYRLIVDATFDGIVISQNGFIKDANPGYARMFGYERSELIGRSVFDLVAAESKDMVTERIRNGQSGGYDVTGVRRDGSRFTFDTVVRVHGQGDHQIRVAALRDTTAQRKLEEQFRQSQKMEAVGRLAGGVAHDFNNLLTVILGYAEMLLMQETSKDAASRNRTEQLEQIRDAGDNAAALTQQLLAFSRQQVLRPQALSLNTVVASTEKLLRRLIGEDVGLQSVQSPDLRVIEADPGQLSQVLMNLAVNARDAMPNGGLLMIETANIDLDSDYAIVNPNVAPGRYVQLSVSDSGTGMDEATQRRIFEPFFTTKEVGKGTGLGLASVYGIVQQSGGHIWVYSEPGHGTTFKLYFPAVDEPADVELFPELALRSLCGTETILIAEDAGAVRELAKNVLQGYGYNVIISGNAQAAIEAAAAHIGQIDLLLTDVVMPGLNGGQLAEHLEAIRPDMKVLFMSGYTSDAVLQRGILGPGKTLLQKPFTPVMLARCVRDVLDGVASARDGSHSR